MTGNELVELHFSNPDYATDFYEGETVEDIKNNAPKIFSAQNRAITKEDFETFIKYNFSGSFFNKIFVVFNFQIFIKSN